MTTRDAKARGRALAEQLARALAEDYPHTRDYHAALGVAATALRTIYLRAVLPLEADAPDVELRTDDDGALDDVVVRTPTLVRLERMDDKVWWLRVEVADQHAVVLYLSSAARIDATVEHE